MTIEKALNRLVWWVTPQRDVNGNIFFKNIKPNRTDLESVNFMIEWVKRQKEITINNNMLFAKLYIYTYHTFLKNYSSSVFDEVPQKELNKLLDKPLERFVEAFTTQLNDNHIYEKIDQQNGLKSIDDISPNWDIETVQDNLFAMITEALNRYEK